MPARLLGIIIFLFGSGVTFYAIMEWVKPGADQNNLTLIHEFKGLTSDPNILEFIPSTPLTNIQFVKIVTTQSSSWVAWREIEVDGE